MESMGARQPKSKKHVDDEVVYEFSGLKTLFRKYLNQFPHAIQQIIRDIKIGKLKEKNVRLPGDHGQLCFYLKNNQVTVKHIENPASHTHDHFTESFSTLYEDMESSHSDHPKSLAERAFGKNVIDQIESSIED